MKKLREIDPRTVPAPFGCLRYEIDAANQVNVIFKHNFEGYGEKKHCRKCGIEKGEDEKS